jgi:hypothetical protein
MLLLSLSLPSTLLRLCSDRLKSIYGQAAVLIVKLESEGLSVYLHPIVVAKISFPRSSGLSCLKKFNNEMSTILLRRRLH